MPSLQTNWKFYSDNSVLWNDMLEACRSATKSIDLEQFIFVNDEVGKQFIEICTEKAHQGVRVRFLFDDAGSWNIFGALLASDLSRKGIQVRFFNTILPRSLDNHRWWFFRNHRRSLVVDGATAFTGSMTLWSPGRDWHDANVRFMNEGGEKNGPNDGSVLAQIERAFSVMWDRANNIRTDWGNPESQSDDHFTYVTNGPIRNKRFMYNQLIEVIRSARSYIYITTPYFVPDRRLIRVLRLAARRRVDVRIVIPESSDHPVVDLAGRSFYTSLLKSGASIYRHPDQLLHSKVIVIDGEWGSVGTMNLDHVSLLYNFEANIVSSDKEFVSELHEYCRREVESSRRVILDEWERRNPAEKWLEFLTRFIRPFL